MFGPNSELRLIDQMREVLRYYHYAYKTEQTYCDWIVSYVKYHNNKKHPKDMEKKLIPLSVILQLTEILPLQLRDRL